MKWREIVLGAMLSLLVTVVGGYTIWKLTKEPPKPELVSDVIYQSDSPARFSSESQDLSFYTVRVRNRGTKLASSIRVSIEFDEQATISDALSSMSSGNAAENAFQTLSAEPNEKLFQLSTLLPGEEFTTQLLVADAPNETPQISVRHSEGIGKRSDSFELISRPVDISSVRSRIAAAVSLVMGLSLPLMLIFIRRALGGTRSVNNSAFMLLHKGLVSEAKSMLESDIYKRGSTAYELSNLGLCFSLTGSEEQGELLQQAAETYSSSRGIKLLVAFNRAIASYKADDAEAACNYFSTAWGVSKRTVRKYLRFSVVASDMVEELPELRSMVANDS